MSIPLKLTSVQQSLLAEICRIVSDTARNDDWQTVVRQASPNGSERMTTHTTTRVHLSRVDQISPGSIVRLGGAGLFKVITPRILESTQTREWVYDASLYGYEDAEPVTVEFIGHQADPHVRALIEEERK